MARKVCSSNHCFCLWEREAFDDNLNLPRTDRLLQRKEEVGLAQIAVVLGDLVLQDQVVSERVPGQVGDQAVVLMPVVAVVSEHQIGVELPLQGLEPVLDRAAEKGAGQEM